MFSLRTKIATASIGLALVSGLSIPTAFAAVPAQQSNSTATTNSDSSNTQNNNNNQQNPGAMPGGMPGQNGQNATNNSQQNNFSGQPGEQGPGKGEGLMQIATPVLLAALVAIELFKLLGSSKRKARKNATIASDTMNQY